MESSRNFKVRDLEGFLISGNALHPCAPILCSKNGTVGQTSFVKHDVKSKCLLATLLRISSVNKEDYNKNYHISEFPMEKQICKIFKVSDLVFLM